MASNKHLPEENGDSPASPTMSIGSSGRTNFQSHGRTMSAMAAESSHPSRSNRFSVQFPIQSATRQSPARTSFSSVREPPSAPPDTPELVNGASGGNYLHLIAGQERRVLELKEELQRAEADLTHLKREWARYEVNKKRTDADKLTRLQPLKTSLPDADPAGDEDGSSAWMQQEMERRKALMSSSRTSNRTVLPGQRHTRTLSLLSPAKDGPNPNVIPPRPPPRKDSLKNRTRQSEDGGMPQERPSLVQRSSTISDMHGQRGPDGLTPEERSIDHDALLRAGKKVATDFKDGLWTFWEDLRQATVGEEAMVVHPPSKKSSMQNIRKQSSRNTLRESSKSSNSNATEPSSLARKQSAAGLPDLADPLFWTEHGIPTETTSQAPAKKASISKQAKRLSAVSNDGWDTWDDSPAQSRSSSSVTSEALTVPTTVSGSPRPSLSKKRDSRDLSKKEAIPWPTLKRSGFGSLKRTASNLLTEWERSLTPSPGTEFTSQHDYVGDMGASAEAAAYEIAKGKND
ncbi:Hypothetical predicted protein [Lecanosticta acicola]|uniref:DUF4048 domain-containing protein n=1 Tax=Lecanosticta acicola TaxID=111012 RepID=A0AAI9EF48_9PEZI|nr:Hypothetical predicted protein [Lecanosticta acicola]